LYSVLLWSGLGLVPPAAVLLVIASNPVLLRVAAMLAMVAVVLIGVGAFGGPAQFDVR
jgi:hypothetical protein